jgi:small subunit ribosomal protein S8
MTDPNADMVTRIRNGTRIELPAVDMPSTKMKRQVAQVLKDEGFIIDFQVGKYTTGEDGRNVFHTPVEEQEAKQVLRVFLKYGPNGERVVRHIERKSTPGCRVYKRFADLRPVLDGLGIAVLSTSKGVMSDRQAKAQRMGGELICEVW